MFEKFSVQYNTGHIPQVLREKHSVPETIVFDIEIDPDGWFIVSTNQVPGLLTQARSGKELLYMVDDAIRAYYDVPLAQSNGSIKEFLDFHKGGINIIAHVFGFTGIFYSVYRLDWRLFIISLVVLELGHVYNHFAGIKTYELRPALLLRQVAFLAILVLICFTITHFL